MKLAKLLAIASLCLLGVWSSALRAANTTNFTDQWFIEKESGWGAAVLQQGQTLFVDLFVFGQDTKATWFVAAATFQGVTTDGHLVFAGDLYTGVGPYFGSPFDSSLVAGRKVGTLIFEADSVTTAIIGYTVDGVTVLKNVTRQFLAYEYIGGSYYGGLILDYANCTDASRNGHVEELGALQITQAADNAVTMAFQVAGAACTFAGKYSQSGHMGALDGTYTCNNGVTGPFNAFEIERSVSGLTGRIYGQNASCSFTGRMGGVLR
jgi:hypothetical protein